MSQETLDGCFRRLKLAREIRQTSPELASCYAAIKAFQTQRFELDYSDLLSDSSFRDSIRFFLTELYGPKDFTERDEQFERISPAVERLFPSDVVETVERLLQLHSLSEELDVSMARACIRLDVRTVDEAGYRIAWRSVGCQQERRRQLDLVIWIGAELSVLTRRRALRRMLGLMRLPAKLAGMEQLQSFLERGFDIFASLKAPEVLLNAIEDRESRFLQRMDRASSI